MQVAVVLQQMVEMGNEEAAARLLAELAHSVLSVACCIVIKLVQQVRGSFHHSRSMNWPLALKKCLDCKISPRVCIGHIRGCFFPVPCT